jgi:alpha-mannosidase
MEPTGKESVNFAFPFHVPAGQARLEIPLAVIRPEQDQMPSACKNWLTVGRWADVSNDRFGVTWVTLDAPLVQVGGITATLLNSQTNPAVWRKHVEPTQKLYSWAMNNHWGTNYRAYQEGEVLFRFVLRPHQGYEPATASRLAIGRSQPLLVTAARPGPPAIAPFRVAADNVLVIGLKPSDDGRAIIVRLWEATGQPCETALEWTTPPASIWLSDTSELPHMPLEGPLRLPPWGLVTVRAEFEP